MSGYSGERPVMAANTTHRGQPMRRHLTVSDVARRLGVRPRDISDLFYARQLDDGVCPVVGGRRLIPGDYVPAIATALGRPAGKKSKKRHAPKALS
jgi:hypothetical protein